ncbi:MAG: hypothetical protein LBT11_05695, partial [Treponema sp.]|nr:hypothetical protein [Treponema sp.]
VYREAPTTVNRLEKDGKKAAAIESMRVFARDNIRSNPKMTDPQKAALGVTIRDMDPSPAVIPGAGPGSVVLNRDKSPGFVIIRYLGGRPAGVIACEIRFGILGAAPANVEDLLEMDTFTHNPWKRAFPLSDRGGKFFFALRWIVSGGAKSPWTEIRECIIP